MGGVFFVAAVFVVLAVFFAATWRLGPPLQFVIVFAFFGLVVADSRISHSKLEKACENDRNVVVKSKAERVKGVRFSFPYSLEQDTAKRFGYRFVEAQGPSVPGSRMDRSTFADGKESMTTSAEALAGYELARTVSESGGLVTHAFSVRETTSGKELGRARWFALRGGWVERIVDNYFSDGGPREFVATCREGSEEEQMKALLHATLSPVEGQ